MFIAALFTTSKIWKQPKSPSTDEWIKMMWSYIEWNITQPLKKNEILPFATMWMDLECTVNEISQIIRQICYVITYMWNLKIKQTNVYDKTETDSVMDNKLAVTSEEKEGGGERQGYLIKKNILLCIK